MQQTEGKILLWFSKLLIRNYLKDPPILDAFFIGLILVMANSTPVKSVSFMSRGATGRARVWLMFDTEQQ